MCCGRTTGAPVAPKYDRINPATPIPDNAPITTSTILLRYKGSNALADLANVPSKASYRLAIDQTVTVYVEDLETLMGRSGKFERLS